MSIGCVERRRDAPPQIARDASEAYGLVIGPWSRWSCRVGVASLHGLLCVPIKRDESSHVSSEPRAHDSVGFTSYNLQL
eukprot:4315688-Prymnesium_polylepis.1